jgi:hypothetical protein
MKPFKDWAIFPGYKHKGGLVTFQDITIDHIRAVFFPKDFYETYRYLGSVPFEHKNSNNNIFYAMRPLVIYLDYLAKPTWCPRWFLRFLHLFGNDNSVVRMRNVTLARLFDKITKGYGIWDYKTKWHHYDLRISVRGGESVWWLAHAIEEKFYSDGRNAELLNELKRIDPERAKVCKGFSNSMLEEELERLTGLNESKM